MLLTEKLRAGHVRRWHIVAMAREQTVAEHMYRVGVIAEEILRIIGRFNWDDNLTLNTMRWATIHDRHEFLLGDLPTPGKDALRAAESATGAGAIARACAAIDPEAEELRQCVKPGGECPLAGYIVKYADLLEAVNYVGIFGCGSHAREVWRGLRDSAEAACDAVARAAGGLDPHQEQQLRSLLHVLAEGTQWK